MTAQLVADIRQSDRLRPVSPDPGEDERNLRLLRGQALTVSEEIPVEDRLSVVRGHQDGPVGAVEMCGPGLDQLSHGEIDVGRRVGIGPPDAVYLVRADALARDWVDPE